MYKLLMILAFLLCFKIAVADDVKDIDVLYELPDYLVRYSDYPNILLKIPKSRRKFHDVLKNSSEEKWVRKMIIVANIGEAYSVANHIVFCYEGNKPHDEGSMLRIIYDPVENNLLVRKEVRDISHVSNRIIESVLYGDKYDYMIDLLNEYVECWRVNKLP